MPNGLSKLAIAHGARRVPGLRAVPVAWVILAGEILLLAHDHFVKLEPNERRRVAQLVRKGRARPSNLSEREREELAMLVHKAEPRLFAGLVAQRLSPVPLPKRFVRGPARS